MPILTKHFSTKQSGFSAAQVVSCPHFGISEELVLFAHYKATNAISEPALLSATRWSGDSTELHDCEIQSGLVTQVA